MKLLVSFINYLKTAEARGHDAKWPHQIPLPGWYDIAKRFIHEMRQDYIGLIAAGISFYFLLASFPALAAMISFYGLVSDPRIITEQIDLLSGFLPPNALAILKDQAASIAGADGRVLGVSLLVSLVLAVYSATKGVKALIKGFNIAYNVRERRNILKLDTTAFGLTALMLCYMLGSLTLVAIIPAVVILIEMPRQIADILLLARWPAIFMLALMGLELLYYFGPCRPRPRWRWVSPGSVAATLLWLGGSSLFSTFILNFTSYNETYGSISAVVILLIWFWLSGLMILLGAEINSAIEAQVENKEMKP